MPTDNHEDRVSDHGLTYTETKRGASPLERWMVEETNFVMSVVMRHGVDAAMRDSALIAEGVAMTLGEDPAAAAELHDQMSRVVVDHVLATMQRQRLAS